MKRMYANFTDEAYTALINGKAVDNNGFRSPKGCFYPDQPSFSPINEPKEALQRAGADLLIAASGYVVFNIVLPEVKRFAHEKVYPYASKKWDEWQEKRRINQSAKHNPAEVTQTKKTASIAYSSERKPTSTSSNVINIEDYRKMAL